MAKVRGKFAGAEEQAATEEQLEELGKLIERCKVLYEQFFMGIQKQAPHTVRKDCIRRMQDLARLNLRNTAMRYRFNMLQQKYQSYSAYWDRTLRAIENGTYYKSITRAGREAIRNGKEIPDELLHGLPKKMREKLLQVRDDVWARQGLAADPAGKPVPIEELAGAAAARKPSTSSERPGVHRIDDGLDDDDFDSLFANLTDKPDRPAAPPPAAAAAAAPPAAAAAAGDAAPPPQVKAGAPGRPPPPPKRSAPPAASAGGLPAGMTEEKARKIYDHFVKAKKLLGQDTSGLKYEQIVNTITKQTPKLLEQNKGAKGIDYDVVIKDDRVILKAKPVR